MKTIDAPFRRVGVTIVIVAMTSGPALCKTPMKTCGLTDASNSKGVKCVTPQRAFMNIAEPSPLAPRPMPTKHPGGIR